MMSITAQDVRDAAARIAGAVKRTPVITSHSLDTRAGAACFLKCENFQTSGSFKIRGATNFARQIPVADRPKGIVAVSSGNHAQAVAIAAQALGMHATIIMPSDAPQAKLIATRDRGAEIISFDRLTTDREVLAREVLARTGGTFLHPFDDERTMAGQGTLALELLEDVPDLDTLLVCVGGGGMIAGCAVIAKSLDPRIRVYGVEPALANDTYLSLRANERVAVENSPTIADGLRTPKPGAKTFPVVQQLVDDILLVTEEEIKAAMRFLLERVKIVAEPSGSVCVAAALAGKLPSGTGRVGLVVSGGNVDLDVLCAV
ncbi:MAG: threonine/serine dehydratase [Bryobacteraceae bacterium]|nr:threonine/serine dehydratase [Bryobacteraceae bacterium]